jgi:D-alanyl-D-alanine carboxypeptidase
VLSKLPIILRLAVIVVILVTALAAVTGEVSAQSSRQLSRADRTFVDQTVEQLMSQQRLPGLMLTITGPKGSYTKSYGVANIRTRAPMRLSDHVRIASITKSFTATAVLQLVDRRRLKLSDKLAKFVRGVPNGNRITVRELLAMRSGIYDFTSDPTFVKRFDANPLIKFKPLDIIPIMRRHKPLFSPGARTSYADGNYVLLGIILEKITHRSPASVITSNIIKPLNLRHTSFPSTAKMPNPFSRGYYAGDDGNGALRDYTAVNPNVAWTAGGMVSTLGDLLTWGKALATGTLLSKGLQAQRLHFGTIPNNGPPLGYGLGILRFGNWIGHDGAIFGFSTVTFYDRSNGAQIVAAANLSSNSSTPTSTLFGLIAKRLYPASLG